MIQLNISTHQSTPAPRLWHKLAPAITLLALLGCNPTPGPSSSLEVALRSSQSVAFSEGAQWALVGAGHHGSSLWRLADNERVFDWNHRADEYTLVTSAAFSPEADWVLTSDSRTAVLWNRHDGSALRFWSIPAEVKSVALGPEGERALLGLTDNRAALYAIKMGGIIRSFPHEAPVNSVALSHDGQYALTGGDDRQAILWNAHDGEILHAQRHEAEIQLVTISPDNRYILSAAQYDRVLIWNPQGELVWELPFKRTHLGKGLQLTTARFSQDGDYLLTGRPDGTVQLWDIPGQALIYEWQLPKRKPWQPIVPSVLDVSFTQDSNRYYAAGSDGFIHELSY